MLLCICSLCACEKRGEILIITREHGSGTRAAFESLVGEISEKAVVTNSTAVVLLSVEGSERAISYIPRSAFIQAGGIQRFTKIKIIGIKPDNGVQPTMMRSLYAVTKENASEAALAFLDFAASCECAEFAEELGYEHITIQGRYEVFPQRVVIGGSSSMVPFFEIVCEEWNSAGGNAVLQQSDSSSGIQALEGGLVDIALCSRSLTEIEQEKRFIAKEVLRDEIIIIANKAFFCEEMSLDDLRWIFKGEFSLGEGLG